MARRTVPENNADERDEQRPESSTTRNAVALAASSRKRIELALRTLQAFVGAMTWWYTSRTEHGLLPGRVPLCYFLWVLRGERGQMIGTPLCAQFFSVELLCVR